MSYYEQNCIPIMIFTVFFRVTAENSGIYNTKFDSNMKPLCLMMYWMYLQMDDPCKVFISYLTPNAKIDNRNVPCHLQISEGWALQMKSNNCITMNHENSI